MRETPEVDDVTGLAEYYRHFAAVEAAPVSALYADWGAGVAQDTEVLGRLLCLPGPKRQANLLFAAARAHGVPLQPWGAVRTEVLQRWDPIVETMRQRRTQTNEAGRLAALNLAFTRLWAQASEPLALIEVGASAGLCLYPDAWPIRYHRSGEDDVVLSPEAGLRAGTELSCQLYGIEPPDRLPQVGWRAGIDLNPLDLTEHADRRWLETLVWPGMEHRLGRLRAGAELVAADPPRMFSGDLNELLPQVLDQVPAGTTPVVYHSAVLVYLPAEDRRRFVDQVRDSGVHWVSNEGPGVFPEIAAQLPEEDSERSGFILSLDGAPLARTGPHGQSIEPLGR